MRPHCCRVQTSIEKTTRLENAAGQGEGCRERPSCPPQRERPVAASGRRGSLGRCSRRREAVVREQPFSVVQPERRVKEHGAGLTVLVTRDTRALKHPDVACTARTAID